MRQLSARDARRVAIAAQGLDRDHHDGGRRDLRHARSTLDRLGLIQIDSVSVVARSHELVLFARLGDHPRDLVPRLVERADAYEFWSHEASLLPAGTEPLLRWRTAIEDAHLWGRLRAMVEADPGYLEAVRAEVAERGPLTAGELSDGGERPSGAWGWGWSPGKCALEYLFSTGVVGARRRWADFARRYDLIERVLPAEVLARATPARDDARRALVSDSARVMGVGTAADIADVHRLGVRAAREHLPALVEEGALEEVAVEGWSEPGYLHRDARRPRRCDGRALLSPFDSLIWHRPRTERLFGMRFRVEIYVPRAERRYGYWVMPLLVGDRLVARVDLKAERAAGELVARAVHPEPDTDADEVGAELDAEGGAMATWLGLDRFRVPAGAWTVPGARTEKPRG